uniref:Thioredoxin domain-containing protein n=1 Tax=Strigamia maritima TaxID=126957 RepID=T1IHG2_STRMM
MAITNVQKIQEFDKILNETSSKGNLLVVHFWTSWAPQCKQITEILQLISKDQALSSVVILEVEAENIPALSLKYNINAVPTCLLIKNNKEVARINGANVPEINKKIKENCQIGFVLPSPSFSEQSEKDLNTRLNALIRQADCVLFMKGTANEPRCGFSKSIIEILNQHNTDFSTFDILSDEEVRQGLKTFSNWPTYPQLYIKGELIGGLDIVKEMEESGDLSSMLPKKENKDEKLKKLINKAAIMVFMKGNRETPRCGFSKTLTEILNETGVSYSTFDILEDEQVRQNLKVYSNWPTYPQVYVNGELVGGLDIIKELKSSGELLDTLSVKDC